MSYAVVNPATGQSVASYPTISDEDLRPPSTRPPPRTTGGRDRRSVADRAALIQKVADLHTERRQQLAEIIVREMGKPIDAGARRGRLRRRDLRVLRDARPEFLKDEPIELLDGEGSAFIRRNSLGVLLGIMPWNFPYYQVARFAGPNLVIGNTIILKHASQCPESAAAIEKIFLDAGFPEGAYVNIFASSEPDRVGHRRPARAGRLAHRFQSRPVPRSRSSPASTSRRSCSSSAGPTRSSCSVPMIWMPPSRPRSTRDSTTAVSRATAPSGSS